jgi:required for meiotic nuclear division protein 1
LDRRLPVNQSGFKVRASLLGERLDLRGWEKLDAIATTPLAIELRGGGIVVAFRYGALVFFDVAPQDEIAFLDTIRPRVSGAYPSPETEAIIVRVAPNAREAISDGAITLEALTVERLQLIADILSKSVVLAWYELQVSAAFDRIEPLAQQLEQTGGIGSKARELLKHIGATLLIDHMMVGRVAVSEKPELLWDHPELEGLFARLEDEFEIRERHDVLERKLGVISRTAETLVELIQNRHTLRVEWYIVALIVVEVLISVYKLWW